MAHMIEKFSDGTAAFASARKSAWHQLGTVTAGCMTAREVMDTAYLGGWNVRKLPMTATEITDTGVTALPVTDKVHTARTHPKTGATDLLGTVGPGYGIVQNEEHCEMLDLLVQESGAHFETAGSLRDGRDVFVTMKLPDSLRLAGIDDVDLYLAALNSHDGRSKFRILATPIRVVCKNTQNLAIKRAVSSYAISHTSGVKAKLAEARKALGIVERHIDAFEAEATKLIDTDLTRLQFTQVIDQLWIPEPNPSTRTRNNQRRRNHTLLELFDDAATNANIRHTAWAGVQAVGEYLDHFAPAPDALTRANRVYGSDAVKLKEKAGRLLGVS